MLNTWSSVKNIYLWFGMKVLEGLFGGRYQLQIRITFFAITNKDFIIENSIATMKVANFSSSKFPEPLLKLFLDHQRVRT